MEILNSIWQAIYPYVAGISVTGIISAIIYGCLKGAFNRTINKINVEKIAEKATDKGVDRVKSISFEHSIQPIVMSEIKKLNEQVAKEFKDEIKKTQDNYNKLIAVIEKLSAYFDGSIGVSEQAKAELKQALSEAKNEPAIDESVVSAQVIVEDAKNEIKPKKQSESASKIAENKNKVVR